MAALDLDLPFFMPKIRRRTMFKFGCSTTLGLKDALDLPVITDSISLLLSGVVKLCAVSLEPVRLFIASMSSLWTIPAFWSGANLSSTPNTMSTFTKVPGIAIVWIPVPGASISSLVSGGGSRKKSLA